MFDIGPSELILIFIVALVVIGPEKLPTAVKTAGLWIGRLRRSFHKIKAEVEKELNADEIKRQLHNESILKEVENAKSKVEGFSKDMENAVTNADDKDKTDLKTKSSVEQAAIQNTTASTEKTSKNINNEKNEKAEDQSLAGGLKQAVSYVNDISREVKNSSNEIETEFKNADTNSKTDTGEKK